MSAMTILAILAFQSAVPHQRSSGIQTKIAYWVLCKDNPIVGESVRVLRPGTVEMRSGVMSVAELDRRLKEAFRTRVQRVVFVSARDGLLFQDVVAVLDVASKHADYVALVTPSVEAALKADARNCLDPNIRFPQILVMLTASPPHSAQFSNKLPESGNSVNNHTGTGSIERG